MVKFKHIGIIIFFLLFLPTWILAQDHHIDSVNLMKEIQKIKIDDNLDFQTTLDAYNEVKQKAHHSNLNLVYAVALLEQGFVLFNNLEYQNAIENFNNAVAALSKYENNKTAERYKAIAYSSIGRTNIYLGDYSECLKNLFQGLTIATSIKDTNLISTIKIDIGLAYQDLKDYDNALKYLEQAKKIEESLPNSIGLGIVLHNIADNYLNKKEFQKAIENYKNAISYNNKIGDTALAATSTSDLANAFYSNNQIDSALFYKGRAVFLLANAGSNFTSDYCYAITTYGLMLTNNNQLKIAEKYLKESEKCDILLEDYLYAENYYNFRYSYYYKTKNYPLALINLSKLSEVKESLAKESSNFENQRIAIRYEFNQKANEDSLKYQLIISEKEKRASAYKERMYLSIAIGTSLLAIFGFFTNRIRLIQKNKRRKEIEKMRHDIADDLHDDIGSTLSSIQIISQLAEQQCKENLTLQKSVQNISELANKVGHGIKEIVWSVNPINDNLSAIASHLNRNAQEALNYAQIPFSFKKDIKNKDEKILPETRKLLIMIFKEAINNACKYSNATNIDINLTQRKNELFLSIKDNGKGFDNSTIQRGNGLNNMERRVKALKGSIQINSIVNKGTEIKLNIPLN
ncbi:MAG TPA: tetratricopeptide repeat protein [Edaphocola sp.]|nr:tetratricopeptide repeat protein [Edaphocola sp.]